MHTVGARCGGALLCHVVSVMLENLLYNSVACTGLHLLTFQPITYAIMIGSENLILAYH
jgi:hypothetical protein